MNTEDIRTKLSEIISKVSDGYCPGANFRDMELDSLDMIYLIMRVESEFKVSLSSDMIEEIKNEDDLIKLIMVL